MARQEEGQDFASAAMMRLVALGLTQQGIAVPAHRPGPVPPPSGAHVPHAQKRNVLDALVTAHGPMILLLIADAARSMPPEPVVQALTCARNIKDLLDRWQRLERFSHGRHRVEVQPLAEGTFRLTHRARDAGPQPSFAESLIVPGLLTILAEMTGSAEVSLLSVTGDVWRKDGAWHAQVATPTIGSVILTASFLPVLVRTHDETMISTPSQHCVSALWPIPFAAGR